MLSVVSYACNPSSQEAEAARLPEVLGQPGLYKFVSRCVELGGNGDSLALRRLRQFKACLGYTARPCLKTPKLLARYGGTWWYMPLIPAFRR